MDCITARLTVYFEDPFWVGVLERQTGGRLTACKVTFGACPSDAEVYRWLLKSWHTLHFSPPVKGGPAGATVRNPKRMQRIARQETTRSRRFKCSARQPKPRAKFARGQKKRPRLPGGLRRSSKSAGKSIAATEYLGA